MSAAPWEKGWNDPSERLGVPLNGSRRNDPNEKEERDRQVADLSPLFHLLRAGTTLIADPISLLLSPARNYGHCGVMLPLRASASPRGIAIRGRSPTKRKIVSQPVNVIG